MKPEIKYLPCLRLVGETYIFVGAFNDPIQKDFWLKEILMKKFILN